MGRLDYTSHCERFFKQQSFFSRKAWHGPWYGKRTCSGWSRTGELNQLECKSRWQEPICASVSVCTSSNYVSAPSDRKHSGADLMIPSLLLSCCFAIPRQLPLSSWSRLDNYQQAQIPAREGKDMPFPFKIMTRNCTHHFYLYPPSFFLEGPHFIRGVSIPYSSNQCSPISSCKGVFPLV